MPPLTQLDNPTLLDLIERAVEVSPPPHPHLLAEQPGLLYQQFQQRLTGVVVTLSEYGTRPLDLLELPAVQALRREVIHACQLVPHLLPGRRGKQVLTPAVKARLATLFGDRVLLPEEAMIPGWPMDLAFEAWLRWSAVAFAAATFAQTDRRAGTSCVFRTEALGLTTICGLAVLACFVDGDDDQLLAFLEADLQRRQETMSDQTTAPGKRGHPLVVRPTRRGQGRSLDPRQWPTPSSSNQGKTQEQL